MIDLSKDKGFNKKLSGVELEDNQGVKYQYKAVTDCIGFPGLVAEFKSASQGGPNEPRHVRLTEDLVFIPNDLVGEFLANLTKRLLEKATA